MEIRELEEMIKITEELLEREKKLLEWLKPYGEDFSREARRYVRIEPLD